MSALLLDTLKRSELDQYFANFTSNGITELESLAQLSMQDYNNLGIVSIHDRKKMFQLVQSLRQELPTLENGLVSSHATQYQARRPSRPAIDPYASSNLPDLTSLSMSRRSTSNNGSPSAAHFYAPQTQHQQQQQQQYQQQQQQQQQQPTSATTPPVAQSMPLARSRSRTLPDQHQRPMDLFSKQQQQRPPQLTDALLASSDDEDDDDDEAPEILQRDGANALLNPYGLPNKPRSAAPKQQQQSQLPTATTNNGNNAALGQSDLNQKIRVCVRKRPLNKKELDRGEKDISPAVGTRSIHINEPKMKVDLTKYIEQHAFTFDDVFDVDDSNDKIYQRTAQPLVHYVFNGGKATCFAYGQTGSGKTYTMLDPDHGLYVLAARDVFALLCQPEYQHLSAYIGFYEIYQGQLYDLLNARKKLFAREDGKQNVVIVGLKEYVIKNVEDLMKVFEYGSQCRSTGSTGANSDSSRSHAILQVLLRPTKNRKVITGKLSFIDLAGSERGADRGDADVKTRMEGAEINKSLLALKECIRALDQDKRHTPFRQSKLTQVLKDSFVGRSRTCMIATISPNQSNSEHTLNTLRYADRVKELKGERDRRGMVDSNGSPLIKGRAGAMQGDNVAPMPAPQAYTSYQAPYAAQQQAQASYQARYDDGGGEDDDDDVDVGYLDDPDLFQNHDDFLGDEGFPSDGDVHILDEDFPHEATFHSDDFDGANERDNEEEEDDDAAAEIAMARRPSYLGDDDDDDDENVFNQPRVPKRQPTPYHRTAPQQQTGGMATTTAANKGSNLEDDANALHSSHSSHSSHPSMATAIPSPVSAPASRSRQSSIAASSSAASAATSSRHTPPSSLPGATQQSMPPMSRRYEPAQPSNAFLGMDDTPVFDPEAMEEFIRFHRAEIRETSEWSKKETKLLTHFSLNMSSRQEDSKDAIHEMDRTMADFHSYLNNLDEILDMKMAAVDALRDRIRSMLGEDTTI
ncbi:P-loop containing nucleoside triphosphate hydrolase protein [Gongronella butleri]|nr:P-loop containing nucleoside triphosphate hydrolase protein [Gongronella butleri]